MIIAIKIAAYAFFFGVLATIGYHLFCLLTTVAKAAGSLG